MVSKVAVMDYYEDQKEEAIKKAIDFRKNRLPKYFNFFERVLKGNESSGKGKYLVGEKLSYADTVRETEHLEFGGQALTSFPDTMASA